jgi:hypothetical protein
VTTLIYTGSDHDFLYDNNGNGIGDGVGQHGLIANIAVNYTLTPQVELYVNGWNIFDSRFEPERLSNARPDRSGRGSDQAVVWRPARWGPVGKFAARFQF